MAEHPSIPSHSPPPQTETLRALYAGLRAQPGARLRFTSEGWRGTRLVFSVSLLAADRPPGPTAHRGADIFELFERAAAERMAAPAAAAAQPAADASSAPAMGPAAAPAAAPAEPPTVALLEQRLAVMERLTAAQQPGSTTPTAAPSEPPAAAAAQQPGLGSLQPGPAERVAAPAAAPAQPAADANSAHAAVGPAAVPAAAQAVPQPEALLEGLAAAAAAAASGQQPLAAAAGCLPAQAQTIIQRGREEWLSTDHVHQLLTHGLEWGIALATDAPVRPAGTPLNCCGCLPPPSQHLICLTLPPLLRHAAGDMFLVDGSQKLHNRDGHSWTDRRASKLKGERRPSHEPNTLAAVRGPGGQGALHAGSPSPLHSRLHAAPLCSGGARCGAVRVPRHD